MFPNAIQLAKTENKKTDSNAFFVLKKTTNDIATAIINSAIITFRSALGLEKNILLFQQPLQKSFAEIVFD